MTTVERLLDEHRVDVAEALKRGWGPWRLVPDFTLDGDFETGKSRLWPAIVHDVHYAAIPIMPDSDQATAWAARLAEDETLTAGDVGFAMIAMRDCAYARAIGAWPFVDNAKEARANKFIYTESRREICPQCARTIAVARPGALSGQERFYPHGARSAPCKMSGRLWKPGGHLRRERVAHGMSLRQVADASGLSHVRLGEIERDVVAPSWDEIREIARAIGAGPWAKDGDE